MLSNVPFFVIDVGYVQGMNDILSRFLIVLGSEAEAYRCFVNYMETVKSDFHDDGMLDKISKFSCRTPGIMAVIAYSRFQNSKALRIELRGLVLKTVVLLQLESNTRKCGFINLVDNVKLTLTLEMLAFEHLYGSKSCISSTWLGGVGKLAGMLIRGYTDKSPKGKS